MAKMARVIEKKAWLQVLDTAAADELSPEGTTDHSSS